MPRTPSLSDKNGDVALSPELTLCAAVLSQAWRDLRSPEPYVRSEAERFWQDAGAVRYWSELTGIDLQRYAP
jgi:hypothetical protein